MKLFIANSQKNFAWTNELRARIRADEDYILNERIAGIATPTLVFWGRHDGVIDVAAAPVWQRGLQNARLVIWEDMGHAPQYEAPERTASLIRDFLAADPAPAD